MAPYSENSSVILSSVVVLGRPRTHNVIKFLFLWFTCGARNAGDAANRNTTRSGI